MNYNSMHAAGQVWGALMLLALLAALIGTGSWGALAFIAAGTLVQFVCGSEAKDR